MGIEPTSSAWKAEVLPLNYTRLVYFVHLQPALGWNTRSTFNPSLASHSTLPSLSTSQICYIYPISLVPSIMLQQNKFVLVEGVGFEPTKAEPTDLQSAPVDRLGTPPKIQAGHSRIIPNHCQ